MTLELHPDQTVPYYVKWNYTTKQHEKSEEEKVTKVKQSLVELKQQKVTQDDDFNYGNAQLLDSKTVLNSKMETPKGQSIPVRRVPPKIAYHRIARIQMRKALESLKLPLRGTKGTNH